MLILENLPRKRELLARHIGYRDLHRAPEFAETQEESRKEPQQKDEPQSKLEYLRAEKGFLLHLCGCLLLRFDDGTDLLCLHG